MSTYRVAVVHLGRTGGMGSNRRLASLADVLATADADTIDVALRAEHGTGLGTLRLPDLQAAWSGAIVPEALSWSSTSVVTRLERERPDLIICVTSRCYHPAFAEVAPVVIDFVDRLSVSYADRARIVGFGPKWLLFKVLAMTAGRFERRPLPAHVERVAAGWADADALDATWVPNTYVPAPSDGAAGPPSAQPPTHDVVFFGNLSYPPNVEAVERMAKMWPDVLARRPGTTALIAGAHPSERVRRLAAEHRWSLVADFDDLALVLRQARLSLVPLAHASGIQNKVIEAAAHGLAQVATPVAMAGLRPGFPVALATTDDELVAQTVRLLDDERARADLAEAAKRQVVIDYAPESWAAWANTVLRATCA